MKINDSKINNNSKINNEPKILDIINPNISNFIINNKYNNIEHEINDIYNTITNFFKSYTDKTKIDSYFTTIVPISDTSPVILVIRERLLRIIKSYSSVIINQSIKDIYYTIKIDNKIKLKLLLCYSIFYYIDNNYFTNKLIIGLDFEFNQNKIALMQIGFFPNRKHKYIFVLEPDIMNESHKEILIKTVFISNIFRIVHGAESLDIPYIFDDLLNRDTNKIFKFTKTMFDTRYLCEFYKIVTNYIDKKCSIYDALLYFNVINKKKYNELEKMNVIMGPIQDVQWNIKKISSFHLKYVLYDVLYLKDFIFSILNKSKKQTNTSIFQQLKYIAPINRFICYDKYNLLNLIERSKQIVDPINNYIIYGHDMTLIMVYNKIIEKIIIPSVDLKISKLLEINNYKKPLTFLFKHIIYSIITNKYEIYVNKREKYNDKLTYENITNSLIEYELNDFALLLERFHDSSKSLILTIL